MINRILLCLAVLVASGSALAQEQRAVSALGRLEPEHGIIRVSASSTPEAILGAILVELHAEEGDDVSKGDLLAVTDSNRRDTHIVHRVRQAGVGLCAGPSQRVHPESRIRNATKMTSRHTMT